MALLTRARPRERGIGSRLHFRTLCPDGHCFSTKSGVEEPSTASALTLERQTHGRLVLDKHSGDAARSLVQQSASIANTLAFCGLRLSAATKPASRSSLRWMTLPLPARLHCTTRTPRLAAAISAPRCAGVARPGGMPATTIPLTPASTNAS